MAGENPAFVAFVHRWPCCAPDVECYGVVQAHHAGSRGYGQRAHDDTCIPLCVRHHQAWHDCQPPFRGWTRDQRTTFAETQIARMRARWERYRDESLC